MLGSLSCSRRVEEPLSESRLTPSPTVLIPSSAPSAEPASLVEPTPLLTLPSSAYQASIFVDADAVEVLTHDAAYHLVPGREPLRQALNLGFAATVTRQNYVYWSNGAIWSAPRRAPTAGGPRRIQTLSHQPQHIVSDIAGEALAWVDHSEEHRYSLGTAQKQGETTLYTSPGSIDALTLIADSVYFVERPDGASWRIGRAPLSGAAPSFTAPKVGRWPAMLSGAQELVYCDGKSRDVLALSLDLRHEHTLAKGLICSPLSATQGVYCAAMNTVFEVPEAGKPRQLVASSNLITGLSGNAERLAFIVDVGRSGQDQLAVKMLPLTPNASAAPR